MNYNFKEIKIENLVDVNLHKDNNNYYLFNNVNFYYKINNKNAKKLLIGFHGANSNHEILFRGYNYDFNNINVLSICDVLPLKYENIVLSWYLSTNKINNENIYQEIISYFNNKYEKLYFFGSSGGGFPSIKYACLFNQYAIVGNSQLYLENYSYFPQLIDELKKNNDKLIYSKNQIENILLTNTPKKILIFNNLNDNHLQVESRKLAYYKRLLNFLNKNKKLNRYVSLFLFNGVGTHPTYFPNPNTKLFLEKIIDFLDFC